MANKNRKPNNRKKVIVVTMFAIGVAIVVTLGIGYSYVRNKVYVELKVNDIDKNELVNEKNIKDEPQYSEVKGVTNILLIGADGVTPEDGNRSDSLLIATLDSNYQKLKLTSLYRDTLVDIPNYGENKLNAAFNLGGAELLLQTIKCTYDISIDKYLIVNFKGFEKVIDEIGGVEVDVKENQLQELNKYIGEETGGNDCPITISGIQVLNGKQALSYARIRKGVGDDFGRTTRQREVLFKIAEKLKDTSPIKYLAIMDKIIDNIKTNIEPIDALNMAYTIYKFPTLNTEQLAIPAEGYCVDKEIEGIGSVLDIDKESNTKMIKDFIFGKEIKQSVQSNTNLQKDVQIN